MWAVTTLRNRQFNRRDVEQSPKKL
jgi:hypothetical protein